MMKLLKRIFKHSLHSAHALGVVAGGLVLNLFLFTSCDSFDCKLENTIELQMGFYDENGEAIQLNDTLSVMAMGTDSVLLNRSIRTHKISIPMSHYRDCDSLVLKAWGDDYVVYDTLALKKTNKEFFEGLDCPVKVKHTLTGATTTQWMIKEIKVVCPLVDYTNVENIKIILRTAAE